MKYKISKQTYQPIKYSVEPTCPNPSILNTVCTFIGFVFNPIKFSIHKSIIIYISIKSSLSMRLENLYIGFDILINSHVLLFLWYRFVVSRFSRRSWSKLCFVYTYIDSNFDWIHSGRLCVGYLCGRLIYGFISSSSNFDIHQSSQYTKFNPFQSTHALIYFLPLGYYKVFKSTLILSNCTFIIHVL